MNNSIYTVKKTFRLKVFTAIMQNHGIKFTETEDSFSFSKSSARKMEKLAEKYNIKFRVG